MNGELDIVKICESIQLSFSIFVVDSGIHMTPGNIVLTPRGCARNKDSLLNTPLRAKLKKSWLRTNKHKARMKDSGDNELLNFSACSIIDVNNNDIVSITRISEPICNMMQYGFLDYQSTDEHVLSTTNNACMLDQPQGIEAVPLHHTSREQSDDRMKAHNIKVVHFASPQFIPSDRASDDEGLGGTASDTSVSPMRPLITSPCPMLEALVHAPLEGGDVPQQSPLMPSPRHMMIVEALVHAPFEGGDIPSPSSLMPSPCRTMPVEALVHAPLEGADEPPQSPLVPTASPCHTMIVEAPVHAPLEGGDVSPQSPLMPSPRHMTIVEALVHAPFEGGDVPLQSPLMPSPPHMMVVEAVVHAPFHGGEVCTAEGKILDDVDPPWSQSAYQCDSWPRIVAQCKKLANILWTFSVAFGWSKVLYLDSSSLQVCFLNVQLRTIVIVSWTLKIEPEDKLDSFVALFSNHYGLYVLSWS